MLIKITEKCSMNCTHCLNRSTSDGEHMAYETLNDTLEFLKKNGLFAGGLIVSGGEPTEHPFFVDFLKRIIRFVKENTLFCSVLIATNGIWVSEHPEETKEIINYGDKNTEVFFQVTNDTRYYPVKLERHKQIFRNKNITFCDTVEHIYPQGRALDNKVESNSLGSKCFNVRAISKQIENCTLRDIITLLLSRGKFCTPFIDVHGNIKLGESDLCPICSNIYKEQEQIMEDIKSFSCHQCDFINEKLPEAYKRFL